MARGKKRKRRTTKRWSTATTKPQPASRARKPEQVLAKAREERNPHVALEMYQAVLESCQGIAARSVFDREAGRMWDLPDARVYLESLFGIASSLWRLGEREEAVQHFLDLLQLDSEDHQSARYWLAASLLDLKRHDELAQLLDLYDEPTAAWRYAQALLAFRSGGDNDDARQVLQEAGQLGADFLDFLLGDGLARADRLVHFGRDPRETTHSLATLFLPAWRSTPGAVAWVREVLRVPLGDQPTEMPFPRNELLELPPRNVTWQVGLRLLDEDEPMSGEMPVWILGIVNVDEQKLLYMAVIEEEPTPAAVWGEIVSAFRQPMEGEPHRPVSLEVPRADLRRALQSMLAEVSVECVFGVDLQPIGQLLGGMAELVKAQRLPQVATDIDPGEFPRTEEVWQADFFHLPTFVSNEQIGAERPWVVIVLDKQSQFVLSNEMLPGEPMPEAMWEYVVRSMAHPGPRDPMRPSVVELSDSDCYDFLKPKLGELGIDCVLADELPELHGFCRTLVASYGGPDKCALADGPRVTMEQMESFYYAAARYFEQAPWKHVRGEIPIEIRCRDPNVGTRYAIVLGRTGVTLGLALHNDWDDVRDMLRGLRGWDEMSGFSVIFDEDAILAPADLYLVERNGWPVPTPEAYPVALRFEPGRQPQSPAGEDLEYVESCLQTIPDFVTRDVDAKTYEVETNGKRIKLRLSWTFSRR